MTRDALHVPKHGTLGLVSEAASLAIREIALRGIDQPSKTLLWKHRIHLRSFDGKLRPATRASWGEVAVSSAPTGTKLEIFDAHVSYQTPIVSVVEEGMRTPKDADAMLEVLSRWSDESNRTPSIDEAARHSRLCRDATAIIAAAMLMAGIKPTKGHRLLLPTRRRDLEIATCADPRKGERVDLSLLDQSIVQAVASRSYAFVRSTTKSWAAKGGVRDYHRWMFDMDGRLESGRPIHECVPSDPIDALRVLRLSDILRT